MLNRRGSSTLALRRQLARTETLAYPPGREPETIPGEVFHRMFGKYTLGIEEEFQLVDAVTGSLKSGIVPLMNLAKAELGDHLKAEFLQCTAETITGICP